MFPYRVGDSESPCRKPPFSPVPLVAEEGTVTESGRPVVPTGGRRPVRSPGERNRTLGLRGQGTRPRVGGLEVVYQVNVSLDGGTGERGLPRPNTVWVLLITPSGRRLSY